jgi:hypothetical protein
MAGMARHLSGISEERVARVIFSGSAWRVSLADEKTAWRGGVSRQQRRRRMPVSMAQQRRAWQRSDRENSEN